MQKLLNYETRNIMRKVLPFLLLALPVDISARKIYEVKDISGKIQVVVAVNDCNVTYSVVHEGDTMIAPSPISMRMTDGTVFGINARVKKSSRQTVKRM